MVHNIWKIDLFGSDGENRASCKVCRQAGAKKYKYKISEGSFKSLVVHTKQHPEYEAELGKLEYKSQEAAVMNNFVARSSAGMTSLDKKVINYVAENCVSFNSMENRSVGPSTVLPRAYEAVVCLINAKLVKLESISFTTDIWSSSSDSFISLTAHGMNQEWKREKFVLAIRELLGSHTGEVINPAIKQILAEWDISEGQCPVFLRDGAANMKKAFEGKFDHADCGAHKLNLSVKGTVRSAQPLIEEVLKKCGKIAGHFSLLNLAKDRLRECQADAQIKANQIIQDVSTCWNSTLAMIGRLLQQKRSIGMYFGRYDPPTEADDLTHMEWKLIKQLALLLKPAEASSVDMCKDDSISDFKLRMLMCCRKNLLQQMFLTWWLKKNFCKQMLRTDSGNGEQQHFCMNVIRFPILSKAARRFLSAPSTSVASDQLFSHAREVFHYKRGQLDSYNAEQLIFSNRALHYVNFSY